MRRTLLAVLMLVPLANCVAPSARAPAPVRPPAPVTVAPPPVVAPPPRDDTGVEPGIWTYGGEPHSIARFGATPQSTVLSIQCDRMIRAISVMVARPGAVTGGAVTLRATTNVKSFPAEGGGSYAIVRIPVRDPILDALAFSRGRFGVALDGIERAFPAWPEFARVVEDCRG